jgi:streptogramin lyase
METRRADRALHSSIGAEHDEGGAMLLLALIDSTATGFRRFGRRSGLSLLVTALFLVLATAALTRCGGSAVEVVDVATPAERTTPLNEARQASIELRGGPDWMTRHGGYVWVKRDDGMVNRIDPRTNTSNGEVRADTKSDQYCQGIGAGGGAIWSCSGSDVVRIDPKQLRVTHSIPVKKVFAQGRLVFAAGKIWAVSGEGDRLVGIDAATARQDTIVELPALCSELGPGVDLVWAICPDAGVVLGVDPVDASIAAELEVERPSVAFGTEEDLWVGSAGTLLRIDLDELEPVARFADLDPGPEGDIHVDGEDVWIRTPAGFLHRVDAATNTVAEQFKPTGALSGGSVVVEAGSLWTTAFDDALLLRLERRA